MTTGAPFTSEQNLVSEIKFLNNEIIVRLLLLKNKTEICSSMIQEKELSVSEQRAVAAKHASGMLSGINQCMTSRDKETTALLCSALVWNTVLSFTLQKLLCKKYVSRLRAVCSVLRKEGMGETLSSCSTTYRVATRKRETPFFTRNHLEQQGIMGTSYS